MDNESDGSSSGGSDTDNSPSSPKMNDSFDQTGMNAQVNKEEAAQILTEPEVVQPWEGPQVNPTIIHYPGNHAGEVCSEGIMPTGFSYLFSMGHGPCNIVRVVQPMTHGEKIPLYNP
jgi:hypothetical protein